MLNEQDAHVTQVAVEGGRRAREPLGIGSPQFTSA